MLCMLLKRGPDEEMDHQKVQRFQLVDGQTGQ